MTEEEEACLIGLHADNADGIVVAVDIAVVADIVVVVVVRIGEHGLSGAVRLGLVVACSCYH